MQLISNNSVLNTVPAAVVAIIAAIFFVVLFITSYFGLSSKPSVPR